MKKKIFNYATNKFENLNAEDDLRPPDVYELNEALNKNRRKDDQIKEFLGMEQEEIDRLYDYRPMTEKGSQEEFSKGWVPDNKPREFDE